MIRRRQPAPDPLTDAGAGAEPDGPDTKGEHLMTTETDDKLESARQQAKAQLDSIVDMVARLDHAHGCDGGEDCDLTDKEIVSGTGYYYTEGQEVADGDRDDYHDADKAEQTIHEDALSVEVRSDWHTPGDEDDGATEYRLLLCTGGPAVQILGDLGTFSEPSSARLMCQDWFTPWSEVIVEHGESHDAMLTFARCFYFGE